MNCPDCGAAMRLKDGAEAFVCDFCHAVYLPDANSDGVRVFGEPAAAECPLCRVMLVHASVGGRRMLYCQHCHGMLIAMDFFPALLADLRAARDAPAAVRGQPEERDMDRRIECPQCGAIMDTHRYGGPGNVIVDTCERCQVIWLDYGELGRIVRAPDPTAA
jgi:Zn-finger nucleic acid-binding protein